jgi:hypothetical protein
MDSVLKQACGIGFKRTTMRGSLTGKLSLNLGPDFNRDRHGVPFKVNLLSLLSDHPTPPLVPASTVCYNITSYEPDVQIEARVRRIGSPAQARQGNSGGAFAGQEGSPAKCCAFRQSGRYCKSTVA